MVSPMKQRGSLEDQHAETKCLKARMEDITDKVLKQIDCVRTFQNLRPATEKALLPCALFIQGMARERQSEVMIGL